MIKLKGNDIYDMTVDSDQQLQTKATETSPSRPYWRGRYAGKGFMIDKPQFIKDWDNGDVAQVTLEEGSYVTDLDDPMNPNQKLVRASMVFSGWATRKQYIATAELQAELDLTKVSVIKTKKLNDEDMKMLQAAF